MPLRGTCKQIGIDGEEVGILLMCGHTVNREDGGPPLAMQLLSERSKVLCS